MQFFCGGSADRIQVFHGKRPELFLDFIREKGVNPVRFFKIGGHFRQQAVAGDADIDGETQFLADRVF